MRSRAGKKTFKSNHQYTLEEFGLSRQWLQKELAAVLESILYGLVPMRRVRFR